MSQKLTAHEIYKKKLSENLSDEDYKTLLIENGIIVNLTAKSVASKIFFSDPDITPEKNIEYGEKLIKDIIHAAILKDRGVVINVLKTVESLIDTEQNVPEFYIKGYKYSIFLTKKVIAALSALMPELDNI